LQVLAISDREHWLVSLICNDPTQASGACHRSLQLLHLLDQHGWQLHPVETTPPSASRWATLRSGLKAGLSHGLLQPLGIDSLRSQGHCSQQVAYLHNRFPNLAGVIQEGTGYGSLCAVSEWRQRGVRTVVVPANIEALAPNTDSWTHRNRDVSQRFANERRWWTMADAIFTISIEEAWWLQLHGICAEWLPYYPAPEREQHLLNIRKHRQPDPTVGWLWLADFRNPANQAGVPLTLKWLMSASNQPQHIQIVGRGLNWLERTFGDQLPPHTRLLGELCSNELERLSYYCTAQLIVHPATSGILTRVVDASIANIPIVGNSIGIKSHSTYFSHTCVVTKPTLVRAAEETFVESLCRQ
jgi:hypothetical protein